MLSKADHLILDSLIKNPEEVSRIRGIVPNDERRAQNEVSFVQLVNPVREARREQLEFEQYF